MFKEPRWTLGRSMHVRLSGWFTVHLCWSVIYLARQLKSGFEGAVST